MRHSDNSDWGSEVSAYMMRMIIAAMMAILLGIQARTIPAQSARRNAFGLSAAAFATFALGNGLSAVGIDGQPIQIISLAGVVLIALSLLMLVRAYQAGEMSEKLRRAREMVAEERAKTKNRDH